MANEKHVYIAPNAAGFSCHIVVDGKREFIKFFDGNYRTDDDAFAEALDDEIANGGVGRHVHKVDRSAAERLVHEHIAQRAATGAHSGQVTTSATASLNALQARDQELHAQGEIGKVIDKAEADSGLLMTEATKAATEKPAPSGIKLGTA